MKLYFIEYYYDGALLDVDFNQLHEIFWTRAECEVEDCKRGKRVPIFVLFRVEIKEGKEEEKE